METDKRDNVVDLSKRREAKKEADAAKKAADAKAKRRNSWLDQFRRPYVKDDGEVSTGGALRAMDDDQPQTPTYKRGSKDDPWMQ